MGASIQFTLNQIRRAHFPETAGDPASEVALGKIEKRVDTAGVDQSAIELPRTSDMRKKFRHWRNAMGFLLLPAERVSPHFQALLQLAEEQVVLVAVMKIESGAAHAGAIEHFLQRDLVDGLLLDQRDQRIAQPVARSPDALIRFASMFCTNVDLPGTLILGHRPPLCSATRLFLRAALDCIAVQRYVAMVWQFPEGDSKRRS